MNYILEKYLLYLTLTEREWNTDTENPDSFDVNNFKQLFGKEIDVSDFNVSRHTLQPSMYNIYLKNFLGDYMGRPDTMNSQTFKHVGFNQFQKDIEKLKKKVVFARKIKEKIPANFFKFTSKVGETSDPGDSGDVSEGGDGSDGIGGGD